MSLLLHFILETHSPQDFFKENGMFITALEEAVVQEKEQRFEAF